MRQVHTTILERISKALSARYDEIANEPLPQRWVDLIRHLDEKEKEQLLSEIQSGSEPHAKRPRSN
jgi:anti-sigma factor NepR-like protein